MRRLALVVTALTLALAAPATAKVWFQEMGGRAVRWDQRVTTSIAGCAGNASCQPNVAGVRVGMRRVGARRSTFLGRVARDGALRFRVPHVRPGRYVLLAEGHAVSQRFRIRAG